MFMMTVTLAMFTNSNLSLMCTWGTFCHIGTRNTFTPKKSWIIIKTHEAHEPPRALKYFAHVFFLPVFIFIIYIIYIYIYMCIVYQQIDYSWGVRCNIGFNICGFSSNYASSFGIIYHVIILYDCKITMMGSISAVYKC